MGEILIDGEMEGNTIAGCDVGGPDGDVLIVGKEVGGRLGLLDRDGNPEGPFYGWTGLVEIWGGRTVGRRLLDGEVDGASDILGRFVGTGVGNRAIIIGP